MNQNDIIGIEYKPICCINQFDQIEGIYKYHVSGGCGSTIGKMIIGRKKKCNNNDHICIGVHNISLKLRSNWMGSNGPTIHSLKGKIHMVSSCYGTIMLNESVNNINEADNDNSDNINDIDNIINNIDNDDNNNDNNICPRIDATIIFLAKPTLSNLESGHEFWGGMGGEWNQLIDVVLIFNIELKEFKRSIGFEKLVDTNNIMNMHMKTPGHNYKNPFYEITFYFDNPFAISNKVQSTIINCIFNKEPLPEKLEREDFHTKISSQYLFSGNNIMNSNEQIHTTNVRSSTEQNNKFDLMSSRLLLSNDLIFSRIKLNNDEWLLAATSISPTKSPDTLKSQKGIDIMWNELKIGSVRVDFHVAKTGKVIITLDESIH